jgi:hypothetical protein
MAWKQLIVIVPAGKIPEAEEVAKKYDPKHYMFTQPLNSGGGSGQAITHYGCQATMTQSDYTYLLNGLGKIPGVKVFNPTTTPYRKALAQMGLLPVNDPKLSRAGKRPENEKPVTKKSKAPAAEAPQEPVVEPQAEQKTGE